MVAEHLPQTLQSPVLQRLHSTDRPPAYLSYLLEAPTFDEPEDDDVALLISEVIEGSCQATAAECELSCPFDIFAATLDLFVQREHYGETSSSLVVDDNIAGNRVEPSQQRTASIDEAIYVLYNSHENVARKVFGRGGVAHAVVDVSVDCGVIPLVDLGEGAAVALLGPPH